jgi:hypothetical protein
MCRTPEPTVSRQDRQAYVEAVLSLFRRLPDTRSRPRPADRQLAAELHRRGVRLDVLEVAMRLAAARRHARPPDADPLPPIRSLHYFLPVIAELPPGPPPPGYLDYLRDTVPDKPTKRSIISPHPRREDRSDREPPKQLRLPLDDGAGPENDAFS